MTQAEKYFNNNYDKEHIKTVVELKDYASLYNLMEEYAEEMCKKQRNRDRDNLLKQLHLGFYSNRYPFEGVSKGSIIDYFNSKVYKLATED